LRSISESGAVTYLRGARRTYGRTTSWGSRASAPRAQLATVRWRGSVELLITQLRENHDDLRRSEENVRHAELRTATEALDHEREAARRFFELSRDMMCIAGPDGFLRRVNPAFAVLGHSTQKLLETPFLAFVHPDDHASTWAVIDVHRGVGPSVQLENRWRCADGSYRWLWWTSTTDSSGIMYGSARDITEFKRNEDTLRCANRAAESANRELESFTYTVAHDLRAPLRSIDGFSQALLEDDSSVLDETGVGHLRTVRGAAQRMGQLIDDLLSRALRSAHPPQQSASAD
jgi:PAS domain S-box-containing protein